MKITIKILLCLLVFCMLLGAFASCKPKKPADPSNSTEDTTTKELVTDEWGQSDTQLNIDKKYGENINILVRPLEQYRREWFVEGGEPANTLEEKIFARNKSVCDKLDIDMNFSQLNSDSMNTYTDTIMAAYRDGTGKVDIVSAYSAYSTAVTAMECFVNLNDAERFPMFHFDQPYWNQSYISAAEVDGYLYTVCGDVNLSVFDRTIVTYLNKNAATDHQIDLDDLYQTVLDGNWTYEKFYKIVSDIGYEEKDNVEGATDGDFYALTAIKGSEASDGFVQAFDLKIIVKNNNTYSLVTGSDRIKLDTAMQKIQNLFYNSNAAKTWKPTAEESNATHLNYKCFTSGLAVFNIDVIYHYESGLAMMRDTAFDIGMIPVPKYDENQANYKASVQDAHNVMSVLYYTRSSATHFEAISALLETLCYETYHDIRPFYFERMIKTRYVHGTEDARVFDMILASTAWDFADVYNANLDKPRERVWRSSFNTQGSVVDACVSLENSINTKIDDLLNWMKAHRW